MGADLSGRRVLVVGASSGIGRAIAQASVRAGGDVVFAARRIERLEAAVKEVGGGHAIAADVRDPARCRSLVEEAVERLGGLDLLVYSSAIMAQVLTKDQTPANWQAMFETNTLGCLSVMIAAADHVGPEGLLAYISSDSVGAPYHGLVPYGVTKAGLDEGVAGLRLEYGDHRFCRVTVGPTVGTGIASDIDPQLQQELLPELIRHAKLGEKVMEATDLGELVTELLSSALRHPNAEVEAILIRPPGGPLPYGVPLDMVREALAGFTE